MRKSLFFVAVLAGAGFSEMATFFGPTGFAYAPSHAVLEQRSLGLGMWIDTDFSTSLSFEYGVGHGIEIGVCQLIGDSVEESTSLNLTWKLLEETGMVPAATFGFSNRWTWLALGKEFDLLQGLLVSAGVQTEDFLEYAPFGGVRLGYAEGWSITADYFDRKLNAGATIPVVGIIGVSFPHSSRGFKTPVVFWGYTFLIGGD